MTLILAFLKSRLGGWLLGLLGVISVLAVLKFEHAARVRAEAREAAAKQAAMIGYESYVKLYQEREVIKAKASKQRERLNEIQAQNDLDGLADTFNNPAGVRRAMPANSSGRSKTPARFYDSNGSGASYQEAP